MPAAYTYYGVSEETLLEWLADAQQDLRKGKTLVSFGNTAGNASSQMTQSPRERIEDIQAALYQIDPIRYAMWESAAQKIATPVFNQTSRSY